MGHRQFDGGDGVGRRYVHHDDPLFGTPFDVDVVNADAGTDDRLHLFRGGDEFFVDVSGAPCDGDIRIGDDVEQSRLVDIGGEDVIDRLVILKHLETGFVNVVTYYYFMFFHR